VRAYGGAAAECLRQAERRELIALVEAELSCDFAHAGTAHALLAQFGAIKQGERFDTEGLHLSLRLPAPMTEGLAVALRDATRGRASLRRLSD
jgi:putative IMPACT (imprinted ancient) family translation regulator